MFRDEWQAKRGCNELSTAVEKCNFFSLFHDGDNRCSGCATERDDRGLPAIQHARRGGKIVGLSTEVVEELFKRAGVEYKLTLMPWKRAYEDTLGTPNTALYSTTRTPEREALFKWVGPLVNNNWVFFSSSTANITVKSLEDAKQYSVGAITVMRPPNISRPRDLPSCSWRPTIPPT